MIHVDWGNAEETLIVVKFATHWNADEFTQAMTRAYSAINRKPYTVTLFLDLSVASIAPKDIMLRSTQVFSQKPENINSMLIISSSPIWRNMWTLIGRINKSENIRMQFVSDANEAYQLAPWVVG